MLRTLQQPGRVSADQLWVAPLFHIERWAEYGSGFAVLKRVAVVQPWDEFTCWRSSADYRAPPQICCLAVCVRADGLRNAHWRPARPWQCWPMCWQLFSGLSLLFLNIKGFTNVGAGPDRALLLLLVSCFSAWYTAEVRASTRLRLGDMYWLALG
jgi:hypothetical protein